MTYFLEITGNEDPFASVLESLKMSLDSFKFVVADMNKVETICVEMSPVLHYANDLPTTLKTCQETLQILGSVCSALSAIPFVGFVAETASSICSEAINFIHKLNEVISNIITRVVNPLSKGFDELVESMQKAVSIISTIVITIPDYLNTIQILSYSLDISQKIVPILSGTSAAESTKEFIQEMVMIRKQVEQSIQPLEKFLKEISYVVLEIKNTLGNFFKNIEHSIETIKPGLEKFEDVIRPIKKAFDAIENAIAPLKWVLDAVESVMKNILEPIVDAICNAFGINALLKPLLNQIEQYLGVRSLFDELEKALDGSDFEKWRKKAINAVTGGNAAWNDMLTAISQYQSRGKGNTYSLFMKMVHAITGSPSGDGPFLIPDWPEKPLISVPYKSEGLEA